MAVSPPINDARFPAEAMKSQHDPCWRSPYLRFHWYASAVLPSALSIFIKGWLLILMCSLWGRFLFIHVTVNPPCSKAKAAFIQAYSGASSYGLCCPASDGRSDTARWFDENRGILHRDEQFSDAAAEFSFLPFSNESLVSSTHTTVSTCWWKFVSALNGCPYCLSSYALLLSLPPVVQGSMLVAWLMPFPGRVSTGLLLCPLRWAHYVINSDRPSWMPPMVLELASDTIPILP